MKKVLLEILRLAWKVLRVYLWKYLKPFMGKMLIYGAIFIAVVTAVTILLVSSC